MTSTLDFARGTTPSTPATGHDALYDDLDYGLSVIDDSGTVRPLTAGIPRVYRKAIAFDDTNILTGALIYTPTIGDVLMDAWFEITTGWDGTTPKGDIGTFVTATVGLFSSQGNGAVTLSTPDDQSAGDGLLVAGGGSNDPLGLAASVGYNGNGFRPQARVTIANPIRLVVTQTGAVGGGDPGSTQGAGFVGLVIVTPILL